MSKLRDLLPGSSQGQDGKKLIPWAVSIVLVAIAIALIYAIPSHLSTEKEWVRLAGMLDHWQAYVPIGFFLDSCLHSGEIPLWNPLVLCGTPFAANIQSFLFYPFNALRSCLTLDPTPMKTHIGLVIVLGMHVLLAGVGTFFFGRQNGMSPAASMVAALAFICSAAFVRRVYADMFITTIAWIPIILILLQTTLKQERFRRKLYYATATAFVFGISILAGSPHMTLLMSLLIACYGLCYRMCHLRRNDLRPAGNVARILCSDFVVIALVFAVAVAISWVMLYPALELSAMNPRSTADNDIGWRWHGFSWFRDYLIFYPGSATGAERDFGLAGLGVTLLALAAPGNRRKRDVLLFALLFLFFLDCAHGPPLPCSQLMLWIAPYKLNDIRRALLFAAFALGLLAGFGTDAIASRWQTRKPSPFYSVLLAVIGSYFVWCLSRGSNPYPIFALPKTVVLFPLMVLAEVVLAGWLPWPRKRTGNTLNEAESGAKTHPRYWIVAWSLVGLVFAEQYVWGTRYVDRLFSTRGFKESIETLSRKSKMTPGNRRIADPDCNQAMNALLPTMTGYDPSYIERTHRVLTDSSRYNIYVLPKQTVQDNHRGNLFLKRLFWLARQYVNGPLPDQRRLFPAATTVFLQGTPLDLPLSPVPLAGLPNSSVSDNAVEVSRFRREEFVQEKNGLLAQENFEIALPVVALPPRHCALLLHYSSDCPVNIGPEFHDLVSQNTFEGTHAHVGAGTNSESIEIPLPDMKKFRTILHITLSEATGRFALTEARVLCDMADEDEQIRVLKYEANQVEVEISRLPQYRILTYLDSFYPGWHAYLDGVEVPIYLADDAFKAVLVPPGTHRIRFAFRPKRVYVGLGVSGAAFILCTFVLVLARSRVRTQSPQRIIGSAATTTLLAIIPEDSRKKNDAP